MNIFDKPSLVVLLVVFLLIAVRQIGRFRLQIWQIMLAGAVAVQVLGSITPVSALKAINIDVMIFLFGMFVVGEALHQSGYLYQLSYRMFSRAKTVDRLVLFVLFGMGGLSALLMNDTLAIICTPLMLYFAKEHGVAPIVLLLALAFAITTGSVLSPIGNPQNLLIAVGGPVPEAFVRFLIYLGPPTLVSLGLTYIVLKIFYRREFHIMELQHSLGEVTDPSLAKWSKLSLLLILGMIGIRIISSFVAAIPNFSLTWIAVLGAAPILLLSRSRFTVVRRIDWATLIFFAAMFVLMESVWRTGIVQLLLSASNWDVSRVSVILGISVLISQFISNVPFVALYLPMLSHSSGSTIAYMALAAGSTIAGNLLILGAASNVIIIQKAEKQGETISFWEFAKIGLPLTIVQAALYWLYFSLL